MDEWEEYANWEIEQTFISCNPIIANNWVFKISALEGRPMIFAFNYYNDETQLVGFTNMVSAREWMKMVIETDGGSFYD